MYRKAYQRGVFSIFYSVGSKPLAIWDTVIRDGYITKFLDEDIKSTVLEIGGTNVSTTYMICPKGNEVLGICMPFLVMIVKNLRKYFSFEVTILDETATRRRFRVSNFQSQTQILPLCTVMPIGLSEGWNQIQFNLAEFTRRAYKKQFIEVQKVKINANIRLRRIYFAERLIPEDQLPAEYKLFFPLKTKPGGFQQKEIGKGKYGEDEKDKEDKENEKVENVVVDTAGVGASAVAEPNEIADVAEIGEDVPGLSKKSATYSKVRGSMQVIKTASQAPPYEDRSSQMFQVPEDKLVRVDASTVVPGLSEQLAQVEKEESEHNLVLTPISTEVAAAVSSRVAAVVPSAAAAAISTEAAAAVSTEAAAAVSTQAATAVRSQATTPVPSQTAAAVPSEAVAPVPSQASTTVPTQIGSAVSTQAAKEDDTNIMEMPLPEEADRQTIVAQTEGEQSGVTVLTEITEVTEINEPVQNTEQLPTEEQMN